MSPGRTKSLPLATLRLCMVHEVDDLYLAGRSLSATPRFVVTLQGALLHCFCAAASLEA